MTRSHEGPAIRGRSFETLSYCRVSNTTPTVADGELSCVGDGKSKLGEAKLDDDSTLPG